MINTNTLLLLSTKAKRSRNTKNSINEFEKALEDFDFRSSKICFGIVCGLFFACFSAVATNFQISLKAFYAVKSFSLLPPLFILKEAWKQKAEYFPRMIDFVNIYTCAIAWMRSADVSINLYFFLSNFDIFEKTSWPFWTQSYRERIFSSWKFFSKLKLFLVKKNRWFWLKWETEVD